MTDLPQFEQGAFRAGRWWGQFAAEAAPVVAVTLNGLPLEGVSVAPLAEGRWEVGFAVPPEALATGVQSFVIADAPSGRRLTVATILTGLPIEDDIRAEIGLLRAELELVKRSLRRIAAGPEGDG